MAFTGPPVIRNGGCPPSLASSLAPIAVSGVITRAIGRRESDSSPMSSLVNSWPARIPLSIRIVEPELPQSSGDTDADKLDHITLSSPHHSRLWPHTASLKKHEETCARTYYPGV